LSRQDSTISHLHEPIGSLVPDGIPHPTPVLVIDQIEILAIESEQEPTFRFGRYFGGQEERVQYMRRDRAVGKVKEIIDRLT
jgi:hypothetical protein